MSEYGFPRLSTSIMKDEFQQQSQRCRHQLTSDTV